MQIGSFHMEGRDRMKKTVVICFIFIFLLLPIQANGQQKVPILVYHSIDEFHGHGSKELYVTPENFEKQIRFLKENGYTLLTFERWNEIKKVRNPIFITIDDGYKNNENVLAIFQKLKSSQFQPSATLFIISDFIGRPNRLSKSDLKIMAQSGFFSIQSHTATHPDLTKTKSMEHELKVSKDQIEKITGRPVIAISYPFGSFNNQTIKEVKKYYLFGLTTTPEIFSEKGIKNETYQLPRLYVKYSTSMEEFKKLIGG
jgi:peptidoglycan/xylan/chitin deacetylase (PgdA/CDA1 family)